MKKYPARIVVAVLCLLTCSAALVPFVTAADCSHPKEPDADFDSWFIESAHTFDGPPFLYGFRDTSTSEQEITAWKWDFGDGEISTQQNPHHTFTQSGKYTVKLTVATACGKAYADSYTRVLNLYCNPPIAAFKTDVDEGIAPLKVTITDDSRNAPPASTTFRYTFDGNHTSTERFPTFTYTEPGVFTINQTVRRQCVNPAYSQYSFATRKIWVKPPATIAIVSAYFGNLDPGTTTTTTITTTTTAVEETTTVAASSVTFTQEATASAAALTTMAPASGMTLTARQATVASPGTGTLSVITTPSGAQIYVDDVLRGASPAAVPNLPAGSHMLRLEQAGYQTMRVPITISDGKTTDYSTALVPESSGGMGMLPLIAGAVVILLLAGVGGYLFIQKKKAP